MAAGTPPRLCMNCVRSCTISAQPSLRTTGQRYCANGLMGKVDFKWEVKEVSAEASDNKH